MSGLTKQTPIPTGIVVHSKTRVLELQYANDQTYRVPFELLRVYSPSAEVQGENLLQMAFRSRIKPAAARRMLATHSGCSGSAAQASANSSTSRAHLSRSPASQELPPARRSRPDSEPTRILGYRFHSRRPIIRAF